MELESEKVEEKQPEPPKIYTIIDQTAYERFFRLNILSLTRVQSVNNTPHVWWGETIEGLYIYLMVGTFKGKYVYIMGIDDRQFVAEHTKVTVLSSDIYVGIGPLIGFLEWTLPENYFINEE